MRRAPALLAAAAALALVLTACAGEVDVAQSSRTLPPPGSPLIASTVPTTPPVTTAPAPCPVNPLEVEEGKPEVTVPEGDPPTELVTEDLIVGEGEEVAAGDTVAMQYVGVSYSTGEQFDASWDRGGEPFTFTLGNGQVIQGWDQGIVGMKVGGRRQLIIPADLAYGDTGQGDIAPGETLIFVVDLVELCPPADAAASTVPTDSGDGVPTETTTESSAGDGGGSGDSTETTIPG